MRKFPLVAGRIHDFNSVLIHIKNFSDVPNCMVLRRELYLDIITLANASLLLDHDFPFGVNYRFVIVANAGIIPSIIILTMTACTGA